MRKEEGASKFLPPVDGIIVPDNATTQEALKIHRMASEHGRTTSASVGGGHSITLPARPEGQLEFYQSSAQRFTQSVSNAMSASEHAARSGFRVEAGGSPSAQRAREKAYWDPTRSPTLWMIPFNIQTDPEQYKRLYQWTQFFYATHYLFPTLVDIYARFPLVGFEHQCKDPYIQKFFDHLFLEELDYMQFLLDMNTQYWAVGEVLPMADWSDDLGCWVADELMSPVHCRIECFDKGTKIKLADSSVKNIEDMRVGDYAITHTGQKQRVTECLKRNTIKEIFEIRPEGYTKPMRLTANHPVFAVKRNDVMCPAAPTQPCWPDVECTRAREYTRKDGTVGISKELKECPEISWDFQWIFAKDLEAGDYVFTPVDMEVNEEFSSSITPEWARLMGYYASEGCLEKNTKKGGDKIIGLSVANTDSWIVEDVCHLAKTIRGKDSAVKKIKIQHEGDKQCYSVKIWDTELARKFKEHCGEYSRGKKLSPEFMQASPELQLQFLEAYINGDGHVSNHTGSGNRISIATVSEAMAHQLLSICHRNGMAASLYERDVKPGLSSRVANKNQACHLYEVWISLSEAHDKINGLCPSKQSRIIRPRRIIRRRRFWNGGIIQKIASVERLPFDDYVYNLEVEGDHSYVADNVAVHNCYPILGQRRIIFEPPTYLQEIATKGRPFVEFQTLTQSLNDDIVKAIKAGHGFELSSDRVTQLKRGPRWAPRGEPLLMRILRHMMVEEKLFRAYHAITERMITPLILAKLGDAGITMPDGFPYMPMQEDINHLQRTIEEAMDSDYKVLSTHFAVNIEPVLGFEVMPKLGEEFAAIEEKMCLIFGIPMDLLKGGGSAPFASTALSADILSQNLAHNQEMLKQFLYKKRYEQVARAHEFYDYNLKGGRREIVYERIQTLDDEGNLVIREVPKLLIPDVHLASMNLRDEATQRQFLTELRQMGVPISDGAMMVGIDYDFDDETDKIKTELIARELAKAETVREMEKAFRQHGIPIDKEYIAQVVAEKFGGAVPDSMFGEAGGLGGDIGQPPPDMMFDEEMGGAPRIKNRPDISDEMRGQTSPEQIATPEAPETSPGGGATAPMGAPPAGGGGGEGGAGVVGAAIYVDKDGNEVVRKTFDETRKADRADDRLKALTVINSIAQSANLTDEDRELVKQKLAELAENRKKREEKKGEENSKDTQDNDDEDASLE